MRKAWGWVVGGAVLVAAIVFGAMQLLGTRLGSIARRGVKDATDNLDDERDRAADDVDAATRAADAELDATNAEIRDAVRADAASLSDRDVLDLNSGSGRKPSPGA